MTGTSEPGDLYELLGVARDAAAAEITRAYRRRARALHPDVQPGQAGEPAGFREVEEAYRVLHDPARRSAYDQALRRPAPGLPAAAQLPAAAWPAGATLWAGPVQVIPPAGAPSGTGATGAADPGGTQWWQWWQW